MNIVFFGTPEFAVAPFKKLLRSRHKIVAVVTQPDRQRGRGRHVSASPVKVQADNSGITVLQPLKVKFPDFIGAMKKILPDSIVVVAYGQILPPEIIQLPKFGCINIHASLLPKYRGAAPINWAIVNGEIKTGVTTMLMDEGMDTGPVLLQRETEIKPDDTAGTLSQRLSETGAELLIETLERIEDGTVQPEPQTGEATYAPILKKNDGHIQWRKSSREISDLVRGMTPRPGAFTYLKGERIKILKAVSIEGSGEEGIIYRVTKDILYTGTGRGLLSLLELQPAGKPPMPVKAFLQGRDMREGMRFD
ncbi:MAG: methionyl-tRNA formyltransferase [Nitrospiraceae bacterium]|nr:MAG: methionyl-tRNA formyltransferase [Nitrospiraceae bacterium]